LLQRRRFHGRIHKEKIPLATSLFWVWRQKESRSLEQHTMREKRKKKAQFQAPAALFLQEQNT
jgi:hypothetical protein